MSFEKKMKKRGNQKLDAFAKNPYHQETPEVVTSKPKSFPTWAKVMIPTFAVATCLAVFMVPMIMMGAAGKNSAMKPNGGENYNPADVDGSHYNGSSDKAGPRDDQSYQAPEEGSQTAPVPHWSEATLIQKYPEFTYEGVNYQVRYTDRTMPIDSQYINAKLADIAVSGYDIYEDASHESNAEIYSIKNIADDASLAIKFNGDTNYYAYQNVNCYFATLNDVMNKVSFNTEARFTQATYSHISKSDAYLEDEYKNLTKDDIMDIIFADLTIHNANTKPRLNAPTSEGTDSSEGSSSEKRALSAITLTTAIDCLGIDNAYLRMWEDGNLDVNLFGNRAVFYLGQATYQSLLSYITSLN